MRHEIVSLVLFVVEPEAVREAEGRTGLRQVLIALAVAMTLVVTGCAGAGPKVEQSDEFAPYVETLRALPGVDSVEVSANEVTSSASLAVTLKSPREGDLAEIGERVHAFATEASDRGYVASEPQVRLDGSTYSYFGGLDSEMVADHLQYWATLHEVGADSIRMRTYTSLDSVPAESGLYGGQVSPDTTAGVQPPRYVLVTLPHDVEDAALYSMLEQLSRVPDPGAEGGEWDFLNLAPRTKGEYVSPDFPSKTDLSYAVTAGNHFAEVDGMANVEVVRDRDHDTPLRIKIAVFDGAMDGVASTEAEGVFAETQAWDQLTDLVAQLEAEGALDYGVEVLASPLADGGNFQLRFSVHGCEFTGDQRWPQLGDELRETWEAHISAERVADPTCEIPTSEDGEDADGSDADANSPDDQG